MIRSIKSSFKIFCNIIVNIMFLCIQWNCLYPYNTILVFHYIFILHYHTKTHALMFYLILVLKVLNRQIHSWVSMVFYVFFFFSFLLLIHFLWKILWYENLVLILNNSFFFLLWQVWYLSVLLYFYIFTFHQLKKIYFKILFYFFSSINFHINI